jgi:hypothetical protein
MQLNRQDAKLAKEMTKTPRNLGAILRILAFFPEGHWDGVRLGG